MPLTELARYLSAERTSPIPGPQEAPFFERDGQILAYFADLELSSRFLPVFDTASGQVHAHTAILQAVSRRHGTALEPHAVFVLPSDDAEFVYLDRLVRTLHAINYLRYPGRHPEHGNLLLKVHSRHVLSVSTRHGTTFAALLRLCDLRPGQITLEVDIGHGRGAAHVEQAVANYKACGFRIAIHRFGRQAEDAARLAGLQPAMQPDIVRLDSRLLESPQRLAAAVQASHALGARTLIEDGEAQHLPQGARASGIDLLQAQAVRPALADGRIEAVRQNRPVSLAA